MRLTMARIMVLALAAYLGGCGGTGTPKVFDIPRMEKIIIDGKADDWGPNGFLRRCRLLARRSSRQPTMPREPGWGGMSGAC